MCVLWGEGICVCAHVLVLMTASPSWPREAKLEGGGSQDKGSIHIQRKKWSGQWCMAKCCPLGRSQAEECVSADLHLSTCTPPSITLLNVGGGWSKPGSEPETLNLKPETLGVTLGVTCSGTG